MKTTVEQAKSNDPRTLKAEIARLKKELDVKFKKLQPDPSPTPLPQKFVIDKRSIAALAKALAASDRINTKLEKENDRLRDLCDIWSQRAQVVATEAGNLRTVLKEIMDPTTREKIKAFVSKPDEKFREARPQSKTKPQPKREHTNGDASKVDEGVKVPKEFATAVAQFGEGGATRKQLTQVTGAKTSTRNAYIHRGCRAGLFVEKGDRIAITDDGIAWLGDDYEELPKGKDLFDHWMNTLPGGQRECLKAASDVYPDSISRDDIGALHPDWATSTRNAYIARVVARELLEEVSRTHVRMADMLAEAE
jgi:hypothetical protein